MKRKRLSLILAVVLMFALALPVLAGSAAEGEPVILDLAQGDIFIENSGYRMGETGELVPHSGPYVLMQSHPETVTTNGVTIVNGKHTLTLRGTILEDANAAEGESYWYGKCGLQVKTGAVLELILDGDASFHGGEDGAAVGVSPGAELHISATSPDKVLRAESGYGSAAIGCTRVETEDQSALTGSGNVVIHSGTIFAKAVGGGAAIGGSSYSHGVQPGGFLRILGGEVHAEAIGGGAAIGNGDHVSDREFGCGIGPKARMEISGDAVVYAQARDSGGRCGAGIGGGYQCPGLGENSVLRISGQAQVHAESQTGSGIGGGQGGTAFSNTASGRIEIRDQAQVTAISQSRKHPAAGIGGVNPDRVNPGDPSRAWDAGSIVILGGRVHAESKHPTRGVGIGHAPIVEQYNPEGYRAGRYLQTGGQVQAIGAYGLGCLDRAEIEGGMLDLRGAYLGAKQEIRATYVPLSAPLGSDPWIHVNDEYVSYPDFRAGVLVAARDWGRIAGAAVDGVRTYVLPQDAEIMRNFQLKIAAGESLVVPAGKTLTVNGTLWVEGSLVEEGEVLLGKTGKIIWPEEDHVHTLVHVPAVPPKQCEGLAQKEHWKCTVCGQIFADEAATQPLTGVNVRGDHLGDFHWEGTVLPDCQYPGHTGKLICESCGKVIRKDQETPVGGHIFVNGQCESCHHDRDSIAYPGAGWIALQGPNGPVYRNQIFTVDLVLEENPGLTELGLELHYDTQVLRLLEVQDQGLLNQPVLEAPSVRTCPYGLYWMDHTAQVNNQATGVAATLTFQVISLPAEHSTPVQLSCRPENVLDCDGNQVDVQLEGCRLSLEDVLFGDADENGTVDQADAETLQKHLLHYQGYETLGQGADVNTDGRTDLVDYDILLNHLAGTDGYETLGPGFVHPGTAPDSDAYVVLTLDQPVVLEGDQVTMTLSISENPGLRRGLVELLYNRSALELQSIQALSGKSVVLGDLANPKEHVRLLLNPQETDPAITGEGEVVQLTFRVLAHTPGKIPVHLSAGGTQMLNQEGYPIQTTFQGGSVEVLAYEGQVLLSAIPETAGEQAALQTVVKDRGLGAAGTLYAAAYDKDGRMLAVKLLPMTLKPGEERTASAALDCRAEEAASYALFFLDDKQVPMSLAWKG